MAEVLSSVFHHAGWMFLPSLGTSILQSIYYGVALRAGQRRPRSGEPLHELHRRRVHILVLVLYLIYTFLQALYDVRLAPDFYAILGVSTTATEKEVKTRFRRLASRFHPDKISQGNFDNDSTIDSAFMQLKLAHDTLLSPAKRFAYDRFGPVIVKYTSAQENLQTKKDYVFTGLRSLLPLYIQGAVSLVLLNCFWFPKYGQFWRYFAILSLALLELALLTHEWTPSSTLALIGSALHTMFPDILPVHLLPFQILAIARRMSISINIFISQLTPPRNKNQLGTQVRQNEILMGHLSQAAGRIDQEASNLVNLGFAPYKGDRDMVERLRTSMVEGISLGTIRQNPEVKDAVARALDRRKRIVTEIEEP